MDDRVIRNITEAELELFASILAEGAAWLSKRGMEMWTEQQISAAALLRKNSIEEFFIGYWNGEPAAVMILQAEDQGVWPAEQQSDSLFLHKLCVRRKYANTGLSHTLVKWAIDFARNYGKKYVRLDCSAERPKLCHFYERLGFNKVREDVIFGKYPTAFYELELDLEKEAKTESAAEPEATE